MQNAIALFRFDFPVLHLKPKSVLNLLNQEVEMIIQLPLIACWTARQVS